MTFVDKELCKSNVPAPLAPNTFGSPVGEEEDQPPPPPPPLRPQYTLLCFIVCIIYPSALYYVHCRVRGGMREYKRVQVKLQ